MPNNLPDSTERAVGAREQNLRDADAFVTARPVPEPQTVTQDGEAVRIAMREIHYAQMMNGRIPQQLLDERDALLQPLLNNRAVEPDAQGVR